MSAVEINKDTYLKWFESMLLMRKFEEKTGQLYGQQKIRGFCHLYIGQEAVAAGTVSALREDDRVCLGDCQIGGAATGNVHGLAVEHRLHAGLNHAVFVENTPVRSLRAFGGFPGFVERIEIEKGNRAGTRP